MRVGMIQVRQKVRQKEDFLAALMAHLAGPTAKHALAALMAHLAALIAHLAGCAARHVLAVGVATVHAAPLAAFHL
ncbi:hypothetical protein ACFX11_007287 [Malus domestica]